MVSARSRTRFASLSRHFLAHAPRISAYPFCASLSVDMIVFAAGCDGWVAGSGSVRKNRTSGLSDVRISSGNRFAVTSVPGGGETPVEASATSFV